MNISLKSKGKAQMLSDLINTRITINVKGKDKEKVSQTLIKAVNDYYEKIEDKVNEIIFESHNITEHRRKVKKTKHNEKEIKNIFDYFLGTAYINTYSDMSAETTEKLNKAAVKLSKTLSKDSTKVIISTNHTYTLSEKNLNDLKTMAVNNAIDTMEKQATEIAAHLGLSRYSLKKIDFTDNTIPEKSKNTDENQNDCPLMHSESIKELDNLFAVKKIEKEVEVTTEWVIIGI